MGAITLNDVLIILMAVGWLVLLEGLLSVDNALVLAMMVRHLPKEQQKRALRYGIWGAFTFRVIAVILAKYMLDIWYLKVIGGFYLLYLAGAHFWPKGEERDHEFKARRFGRGFWGTVVSVELADIVFSLDSILAAVSMAEGLPNIGKATKFGVVIVGGILGILTMRFVARRFILLLERFRGLETGAYGLVAWIGLKLCAGGLHDGKMISTPMNEWGFWIGMAAILGGSLLYKPKGGQPPSPEASAAIEAALRMASGEDEPIEEVGEPPSAALSPKDATSNGEIGSVQKLAEPFETPE